MAGEEALDGMALLLKDEKDRYAKAKALHSRLETTSPPKLQIVCFDFFISKAENIVSEWKKSGENAFDQLPNILRIDMLNYLLSEAHEKIGNKGLLTKHLYKLTYMLMNQTTVKLDYEVYKYTYKIKYTSKTSWVTMYKEFREILAHAVVECPKLEHLAAHGPKKDDIVAKFARAQNALSGNSGIHHLLQLEQLQHLDIFGIWYWTNDGLFKLFSRLKKLITLKLLVHYNATGFSGFQKIRQLMELEEFHFDVDDPGEEYVPVEMSYGSNYESIYSYCAENAPNLKLIGAPTSDCADTNNTSHYSRLSNITPKIKGTSKLEHLHTKSTLPAAEFPNLQHLYFRGPISSPHDDKFFQKFGTYTNLTALYLADHLTYEIIAKMLELVGKQLNTLSINLRQTEETGDLFQILHFCPNLVRFKQYGCCHRYGRINELVHQRDQTSNYEALVTEHNVRLLESFDAIFDGLHGGKDCLFELLVFAPLMKDLSLSCISMTKTQCLLFHDAEDGKLSNLEKIKIYDLDLDPSCSMDDVSLMIQCLVCSAPRLHFIYLEWRNKDMTDEWHREQIFAQSFLDLLC